MYQKIINGDSLDLLKEVEDKSIDLVLTDPPYNIGKAEWDKWKTKEKYIEWCGQWILECERVLKDNGSFYFFHNDMAQIAMLMEWIRKNTKFKLNSFVTWNKKSRTFAWKSPTEKNKLRSWFNTCEYILYYTFQDKSGLESIMQNVNNFPTMREYFKNLQKHINLPCKKIDEILNHSAAEHCFGWNNSQWALPTEKTYKELISVFGIDKWSGFREYEGLREGYEGLRYIHNLDNNHNNVWTSDRTSTSGRLHPTQKPVDIIERIITTSTHEGHTVLDPFMGSGTTGEACQNLNRNFIGFELDEKYFEIAKKRLKEV